MSLNQVIDQNPSGVNLIVDTTLNLRANQMRAHKYLIGNTNQSPMEYFEQYSVNLDVTYEDGTTQAILVQFQRLNEMVMMKIPKLERTLGAIISPFCSIDNIPEAFVPNYGNDATNYLDCAANMVANKINASYEFGTEYMLRISSELRIFSAPDLAAPVAGQTVVTMPHTFIWSIN